MPPQDQKSVRQFWQSIIAALILQIVITAASAIVGHIRLSEAVTYQKQQIDEIKEELNQIRSDVYTVRGSETHK